MEPLTRFHYELQTCPRCLHEENRVVWDVVDVLADPDLKDRLLKKDLHTYTCEMCGDLLTVSRPCLYLDRPQATAIFYHPGETVSAEWMKALTDLVDSIKKQRGGAGNKPWRSRLVHSINDLLEKVHVLSADLDDRILAVVKVALRNRYREDEGINFTDLYFLAAGDRSFLFNVNTEEKAAYTLEVETAVYLRAEAALQADLPGLDDEWPVVDETWAVNWLNSRAE